MLRSAAYWIVPLGILLSVGPPRSALSQSAPATKTLSDTVSLDPTGKVEIDNQKGSITITTWDRAQVGYEVILAPSDRDSVLFAEPDIEHSNQLLSFEPRDSWSFRIPGFVTISPGGTEDPIAHYRVRMPKTAELAIEDQASTIEVSGLNADADIDTYNGEASVDSVKGTLTLETYQGTAEATAIRGGVNLDTYRGTIIASFDEFSASSSAESYSGTLRFFLPSDTGFELTTDLTSAELTVDEVFGTPSTDEERRIFNGGGPELQVQSYSGQVEVHGRKSRETSSSL